MCFSSYLILSYHVQGVCTNWMVPALVSGQRPVVLRSSFSRLLEESAQAPPSEKLIMYDACDENEVRMEMGSFRKRIDARRNIKPKKPNEKLQVCTPFDPSAFNFQQNIQSARARTLASPGDQRPLRRAAIQQVSLVPEAHAAGRCLACGTAADFKVRLERTGEEEVLSGEFE